jgi:hypothetical protein
MLLVPQICPRVRLGGAGIEWSESHPPTASTARPTAAGAELAHKRRRCSIAHGPAEQPSGGGDGHCRCLLPLRYHPRSIHQTSIRLEGASIHPNETSIRRSSRSQRIRMARGDRGRSSFVRPARLVPAASMAEHCTRLLPGARSRRLPPGVTGEVPHDVGGGARGCHTHRLRLGAGTAAVEFA